MLCELFDYEYETNSLEFVYKNSIIKEEYSLIERLELVNLIISQKLKELKKKEEDDKKNEIKRIKENKRLEFYRKNNLKSIIK